MRIVRNATLLAFVGGLTAAVGFGAEAATLSVNFDGSQAGAGPAAGSPYGAAAADWNNTGDVSSAAGVAMTADNAANLTVTWNSANTWGAGAGPATDNESIHGGYLDDSASAGADVTVAGLSGILEAGDTGYLVTVYSFSDNPANIIGDHTINGVVGNVTSSTATGLGSGLMGVTTLFVASGDVVGDALTIASVVDDTNDTRSTIAGVQITSAVPEPGSLALLGLGGLAVLRRRCA